MALNLFVTLRMLEASLQTSQLVKSEEYLVAVMMCRWQNIPMRSGSQPMKRQPLPPGRRRRAESRAPSKVLSYWQFPFVHPTEQLQWLTAAQASFHLKSLPSSGSAICITIQLSAQVTRAGPQDGGLLGVDSSSGAADASSSAAASTEPQLALRGSGARKWGPAQFAPQAPASASPAAAPASAAGTYISLPVDCP